MDGFRKVLIISWRSVLTDESPQIEENIIWSVLFSYLEFYKISRIKIELADDGVGNSDSLTKQSFIFMNRRLCMLSVLLQTDSRILNLSNREI